MEKNSERQTITLRCPWLVNMATVETEHGEFTFEVFGECIKECCAAWQEGRCCRKD